VYQSGQVELHHRPSAYQADALLSELHPGPSTALHRSGWIRASDGARMRLVSWAARRQTIGRIRCWRQESNLRPARYEGAALAS
jgi:hypothetical protein